MPSDVSFFFSDDFSFLFFSFICQYIDARPLLCQTRLGIVRSESVVEVM